MFKKKAAIPAVTLAEIVLQPGESITIRAASSVPPVEPPVEPPIEPPIEPPVPPAGPTLLYTLPWETMSGYQRTQGFGGNTILAMQFTVPADYKSGAEAARISGAEYGGGSVQRDSVISLSPYDFSNPLPNGQDFGNPVVQYWLQVGGSSGSRVVLQAGKTYYCNVRNPGAQADAVCEMSFTMMVPPSA